MCRKKIYRYILIYPKFSFVMDVYINLLNRWLKIGYSKQHKHHHRQGQELLIILINNKQLKFKLDCYDDLSNGRS